MLDLSIKLELNKIAEYVKKKGYNLSWDFDKVKVIDNQVLVYLGLELYVGLLFENNTCKLVTLSLDDKISDILLDSSHCNSKYTDCFERMMANFYAYYQHYLKYDSGDFVDCINRFKSLDLIYYNYGFEYYF